MKLTILTPSYNRAHTLTKLYESLVNQTHDNFEWLIVDDGSNDTTEEIVNKFIEEKKIEIRYIKKENGGKHTALNTGVSQVENEMIFLVDSDDYISNDAVETINFYYNKYKDNKNICAFSFLKANSKSGEVIGKKYRNDEFIENYIECRINKKTSGDKAEAFYTEVLKKYPFPQYEGENFLSEDVVWIEIAKQYDTLYVNKTIYYCEYLECGLSNNDKKMKFNSPLGSMHRGKQMMYKKINFITRLKGAIIYNCYKKELKISIPESLKIKNKVEVFLVIITKILGNIYNRKWKKFLN